MIVAIGAGNAQAEEHLRRVFDAILRRVELPVPVHLRMVFGLAGDGDQLAGELVERHVLGERIANPIGEFLAVGFVRAVDLLVPQDVAPLLRPIRGILGPIEQPIDELVALVGEPCRRETRELPCGVGSVPIASK